MISVDIPTIVALGSETGNRASNLRVHIKLRGRSVMLLV
jgi:hypothetical protein